MEKNQKIGLIEIHIAVFLFGLSGLIGQASSLPPLIIVLGRTFFASLTLIVVLWVSKTVPTLKNRRDIGILSLMGLLLAFHWFTFFQSIKVSTVAVGLITFSTFPLFVTFMEPYFFKERLKPSNILLALLVFLGLLLVVPSFDIGNHITQGVLWGVLSGLTFAVLSLINRRYVSDYQPVIIAFFQNIVAAIALFPLLFYIDFTLLPHDYLLLPVLGVFCTAFAFTLFVKSLTHLKAQLVSLVACLEPVYGILLALVILNESPALRTWMGGGLILGTVFLASYQRK